MPTKIEIKANKAEARLLRKTLTAANRKNLKECANLRKWIRVSTNTLEQIENKHSSYTAKVNKRLAILEGRNNA